MTIEFRKPLRRYVVLCAVKSKRRGVVWIAMHGYRSKRRARRKARFMDAYIAPAVVLDSRTEGRMYRDAAYSIDDTEEKIPPTAPTEEA